MKRIACYPGSFDPITNGHVEVVLRGLKLFDEVVILVANNYGKKFYFTADERVKMAEDTFKRMGIDRVRVEKTDGLVVEYAKKLNAVALIRGLRAVTDFEYEFQLAAVNEYIDPNMEMVFLMSRREEAFISSSNVKELFSLGADIKRLVPDSVYEEFLKRKNRRPAGQCAGSLPAGLCRHPDEGERRHTGAQPCHLRRGPALSRTKTQTARFHAIFGTEPGGSLRVDVTKLLGFVILAEVRGLDLLGGAGAVLRHLDLRQVTLAALHIVAALADIADNTGIFHLFSPL